MRRVLFRADANHRIGTGDLMSFLALADHLEARGWTAHFMMREHPVALDILKRHGARHRITLPGDAPFELELAMLREALASGVYESFCLQVNETSARSYVGLPAAVRKLCVFFDQGLPDGWDGVLCWDPDAARYFPVRATGTTYFLGPEYVILPPTFDSRRFAKRVYRDKRERLLVTMGGADEQDLAGQVARRLHEIGCPMRVTFVAGFGYQRVEELRAFLTASSLDGEVRTNVTGMLGEYMNCDVAIGAGGLTASELVATRTPALLIAACAHQEARCRYFHGKGWARRLGNHKAWTLEPEDLLHTAPQGDPFRIRIEEVVDWLEGSGV